MTPLITDPATGRKSVTATGVVLSWCLTIPAIILFLMGNVTLTQVCVPVGLLVFCLCLLLNKRFRISKEGLDVSEDKDACETKDTAP